MKWLPVTYLLAIGLPLALWFAVDSEAAADVGYWSLVVAFSITALTIWLESLLGFRAARSPEPSHARPPLTYIVAAYLPNEPQIARVARHYLDHVLRGEDQLIVAYNGGDGPDPRLEELGVGLYVEQSRSKAENVNTAKRATSHDLVAVFDADHFPEAGCAEQAWRWLDNGYSAVQGRNIVTSGFQTVAVEFDSIYGVHHPGRARLHGFGLFGGSNGFWRKDALPDFDHHMLTEDIDSTIRALLAGHRIAVDPSIRSYESAPTSLRALWHQRMRWAAGWWQVARRYFVPMWRSGLDLRCKVSMSYLLGWCQVYPWITVQMFPLIGWLLLTGHSVDWTHPVLTPLTLFVVVTGPLQGLAAWVVTRGPIWPYLRYMVVSLPYGEFKNAIARVGQLRAPKSWVVTTR